MIYAVYVVQKIAPTEAVHLVNDDQYDEFVKALDWDVTLRVCGFNPVDHRFGPIVEEP